MLVVQDDEGVAWRREAFALLLEAWVAMCEDPEVTGGQNPGMRKGMEDATFPLYEQYLEHEMSVRCARTRNPAVGSRFRLQCGGALSFHLFPICVKAAGRSFLEE